MAAVARFRSPAGSAPHVRSADLRVVRRRVCAKPAVGSRSPVSRRRLSPSCRLCALTSPIRSSPASSGWSAGLA